MNFEEAWKELKNLLIVEFLLIVKFKKLFAMVWRVKFSLKNFVVKIFPFLLFLHWISHREFFSRSLCEKLNSTCWDSNFRIFPILLRWLKSYQNKENWMWEIFCVIKSEKEFFENLPTHFVANWEKYQIKKVFHFHLTVENLLVVSKKFPLWSAKKIFDKRVWKIVREIFICKNGES